MDPRIGLRDILMRHEWTAERQRVTDVQYINSHINTPGYRKYRPAWKMIAWHARARIETDNASQTSVLDALTDAQKNANTTRYVHFSLVSSYLVLSHETCPGKKAPFYSQDPCRDLLFPLRFVADSGICLVGAHRA